MRTDVLSGAGLRSHAPKGGHNLGTLEMGDYRAASGEKEMVDRGRIELPTPGFSGLATESRKCSEVFDVPGEIDPTLLRRNEPE